MSHCLLVPRRRRQSMKLTLHSSPRLRYDRKLDPKAPFPLGPLWWRFTGRVSVVTVTVAGGLQAGKGMEA